MDHRCGAGPVAAARDVMRRMQLEDAALQHGTGEKGIQFVDAQGHVHAQYDATSPGDGPTAEMEILRGELSRLLIDRLDGQTELITGDHITAIAESQDTARVSFKNGPDRAFDLIIVAEGTRSPTRDLIFGRCVPVRPGESPPCGQAAGLRESCRYQGHLVLRQCPPGA